MQELIAQKRSSPFAAISLTIVYLTDDITGTVDRPTNAHDDAHVVRGLLAVIGRRSGLTHQDYEEAEALSAQSKSETSTRIDSSTLASVIELELQDSIDQERPESRRTKRVFWLLVS